MLLLRGMDAIFRGNMAAPVCAGCFYYFFTFYYFFLPRTGHYFQTPRRRDFWWLGCGRRQVPVKTWPTLRKATWEE